MSHLVFLRSFHSVYRHSSVSRAASELALSQPAVSQHLQQLEVRLGEKLFERHGRGIRPTPAAHELHRTVSGHLEALDVALLPRHQATQRMAGWVQFGATGGWAAQLVLRLLPALDQDVRVSMYSGTPPALLDMLVAGKLQLLATPANIPHNAVVYETLSAEPLVLAAAAHLAHVAQRGVPTKLPVIDVQGPMSALQAYWTQCFDETPPQATLVVPDYGVALAAAKAGAGAAVMPSSLCEEAVRSGELELLRPPRRAPQVTVFLARARDTVLPARAAFVRELLLGSGQQRP
jgi:DNA-binding transcriptional LysR family regulator